MKLSICGECGAIISGDECPNCVVRRARVGNCVIVEDEGRCEEYYRGECSDCLWYCAVHDWIGWKKEKEVDDGSGHDEDQMPDERSV